MNPIQEMMFQRWLATKPQIIKDIAAKYPPETRFNLHGKTVWLIGYTETKSGAAGLTVSAINPAEHYKESIAAGEPVCPCCLPKLDALRMYDDNRN